MRPLGWFIWFLVFVGPVQAETVPQECRDMVAGVGAPEHVDGAPDNQVLCRLGYVLSHNPDHRTPDWVLEDLTPNRLQGDATRDGIPFKADPDLPPDQRAVPKDYTGSGYDRGHMAPAGDMVFSDEAMRQSFYMSNMCPQNGPLNRGIWARLEGQARGWGDSLGRAIVVSGPIYATDEPATISDDDVAVPDAFFKVAYDPARHRAIAFIFPNQPAKSKDLEDFIVTIAQVEDQTGLEFFPDLSAAERKRLRSIKSTIWRSSE